MFQPADLSALSAFRVGHAHDEQTGTGCTVVIAPEGATCGVDVRGGGPATRETDLLKPENMIEAVHAVVLSGGSAFGLEASCGVMDALAERSIGFRLGEACVPIVTGACLFDLLVGKPTHPDKAMGRAAVEAAFAASTNNMPSPAPEYTPAAEADTSTKAERSPNAEPARNLLAEGNVGAGCGATVGKLLGGERAMKAGFGYCCAQMGELSVAALVAVNALGCVRNAQGTWIAGCLGDDGQVMDPLAAFSAIAAAGRGSAAAQATAGTGSEATDADVNAAAANAAAHGAAPCENTTLGIILTNARLTKAQATKVSAIAHDAYARSIKPVHTLNDGDTIFTFASGEAGPYPTDVVAVLATELMQQAIERAVLQAEPAYGLPAASQV